MDRLEAKDKGLKQYGPDPCRYGHYSMRFVANGSCLECVRIRQRGVKRVRNQEERRRANKKYYAKPGGMKAQIARVRRWRKDNPEKTKRMLSAYRLTNSYRAKQRKYWKANKEKISKRHREYMARNPIVGRKRDHVRRARMKEASGSFTVAQIKELGAKQDWKCANHRCACDISVSFHIDHMVPISRGGSNGIENIQLLCPPCNVSKGAKLPDEWERALNYDPYREEQR